MNRVGVRKKCTKSHTTEHVDGGERVREAWVCPRQKSSFHPGSASNDPYMSYSEFCLWVMDLCHGPGLHLAFWAPYRRAPFSVSSQAGIYSLIWNLQRNNKPETVIVLCRRWVPPSAPNAALFYVWRAAFNQPKPVHQTSKTSRQKDAGSI